MNTEEDTFNALKKWSKQEVLAAAYRQDYENGGYHPMKMVRADLLKQAGWTHAEYIAVRYGC